MTKLYAVDLAKILFRKNQKNYYVIQNDNEYLVIDQEEYNENHEKLKDLVIFNIAG